MSLVERLRRYGGELGDDAADEIERLRAEVERLRAALQEIERLIGGDAWSRYNADVAAATVAHAALEGK